MLIKNLMMINHRLKLNNLNLILPIVNKQLFQNLKKKKLIKKNEIKLPNSMNVNNRRFTRTNIARALVNRIYFRFEVFKEKENYPFLKMNNDLVERIRERTYRKFHNLVVLNEVFADKIIRIYRNKELKSMTKKAQIIAEMAEIRHLNEMTNKQNFDLLYRKGLFYDKYGSPKYGIWRNTMLSFWNTDQLELRSYYAHLDAKMYNPKFCLDFYPCNASNYNQQNLLIFYLKQIFKGNYQSSTPLNLYFTNYSENYDQDIKSILGTNRSSLPHFIDFRVLTMGDDLVSNNQKLIIIMKKASKEIYFDSKANYILPMYINNDFINDQSERYYKDNFKDKSNVEFVYVPIDRFIDEVSTINFAFYYYVFESLRNGLNLADSVRNAFYRFRNNTNRMVDHQQFNRTLLKVPEKIVSKKRYQFKEFDDLESELT